MKTKNTHGELLEPKMREVHKKLTSLGFSDEHFNIIFHRYLTTPAELKFLLTEIEEMQQLANVLQQKVSNFLVNAKAIVAEGERQAAKESNMQAAN
jgi:hypothetical protein